MSRNLSKSDLPHPRPVDQLHQTLSSSDLHPHNTSSLGLRLPLDAYSVNQYAHHDITATRLVPPDYHKV